MTDKDVGALLRDLRVRAGYTQRELGQRAGVSNCTICYAEKGEQSITAAKFFRIVKACRHKVTISRAGADRSGWIPCSVMDPEREGSYLVTNKSTETRGIDIDCWQNGEWRSGHAVMAWRDLPAAYEVPK